MSFIVKFASIYINKQTNSCPVRKSFRLSLLGMGYGFNKLNMLHSEEQRHWHQKKKKPENLTPVNLMYATLVTRTTHICCTNTFILRKKKKKTQKPPIFPESSE